MDVQGITQTAQVLPTTQPPPPPPEPQVQSADVTQSTGASSIPLSTQVSTRVMDMALREFETAASELISTMAASTGVGSNVDVSV